jgi:hypothetical protein
MKKYLLSGLLGAVGVLALTATGASAAVVCNDEGDCWRVKEKHVYPPDVRLLTSTTTIGSGKATSIAGASQGSAAATTVAAFGSVSNSHLH